MHDVVLVYPPFGMLEAPAVGLSNLKALLEKHNMYTKVLYANFLFHRWLLDGAKGQLYRELYNFLCAADTETASLNLGEFIFAPAAFPDAADQHRALEEELKGKFNETPAIHRFIDTIIDVKNRTATYLAEITRRILDEKPRIVGFSSTYQQTCAAVAIAARLKKEKPDIITVMGGFNCNPPMAGVLAKITPAMDYIFSGEGEDAFLKFVLESRDGVFPAGKVIDCPPVSDLDTLPYPDFSDYFGDPEIAALLPEGAQVPFEGSRGCWWGRCAFCGQNCSGVTHRRKSPRRVNEELTFLSLYHRRSVILAVDTILPKKAALDTFKDFEKPDTLKCILYQLKSDVTFEELQILKNRGIKVCHPAIESLSDHFLQLIHKGTSVINNLRVLRDCRTLDIVSFWNFLYGMPGEVAGDYEGMLELLPFIHHLRPPSHEHRIVIMRYSPMAADPRRYGVDNFRVKDTTPRLYPGEEAEQGGLALHYDGDYAVAFDDGDLRTRFFDALLRWKTLWQGTPPRLEVMVGGGGYVVEDTRPLAGSPSRRISEGHYRLLREFDVPVKADRAAALASRQGLSGEFGDLSAWHYLVRVGDDVLSLVTEPARKMQGR